MTNNILTHFAAFMAGAFLCGMAVFSRQDPRIPTEEIQKQLDWVKDHQAIQDQIILETYRKALPDYGDPEVNEILTDLQRTVLEHNIKWK